jgi:hypothetical protein
MDITVVLWIPVYRKYRTLRENLRFYSKGFDVVVSVP